MKKHIVLKGNYRLMLSLLIVSLFILSIAIPSVGRFAKAESSTLVQTGTYVGDGLDDRNITGVGFHPDLVIVKGNNMYYGAIRSSTMPAGLSKKTDASTRLEPNHIQSLDPDGFQIGSSVYANEAGITFYWVAMKASSDMVLGSYTGNSASQSITGIGFKPEYMMIFSDYSKAPQQRSSTMDGSFYLGGGNINNLTRITSLDADGFTLGSSDAVNHDGYFYHYVAWNEIAGSMKTGTYVGVDGPGEPDSQVITGFGFEPEFVILRPNDSRRGHMQFASNDISGNQTDLSYSFASDDGNSGVIIDFGADGMTIGDHSTYANDVGVTYHYIAWKENVSVTVPPVAATVLSASSMSHTGLTLSWIDNSSGNAQEENYIVKYSTTGPDAGFDTTAATVGPDVTSAPVTGLLPNTAYWFRVTAVNAAGSADSASLPVTTWASPIPDPGLTNISTFTELRLRLSWTNGDQPGMKIEQDTGCDGTYDAVFYDNPTLLTGSPKTVSSGLVEHMCYQFRFGTYNSAGALNTNYTVTNFVTTPPGQAQGVIPTEVTTSSITWAWEPVFGADSYKIYSDLGGVLIGTVSAPTTSFTRSPLGSNMLYVAVVRAYSNTDGEGIASVPSSVYTLALPPQNARLSSATSSSITWAWDHSGQAAFFAQDKNNPADNSGWVTTTSWTQGGLLPGTSYTLQVKAKNSGGTETAFSEVTASTLP